MDNKRVDTDGQFNEDLYNVHNDNSQPDNTGEQGSEVSSIKKSRWFGRGIYGSKDVPIRLLDGVIAAFVVTIIILTIIFSVNGGYRISFDTDGGSEIAFQKLRYGNLVAEPKVPTKPGYEFVRWYYEQEPEKSWDFDVNKVGGDLTLLAEWKAASITVKFELDGGTCKGQEAEPIQVTYQHAYGELPTPVKDGYTFAGWSYSGENITQDSIVSMPGEHVLTALWK